MSKKIEISNFELQKCYIIPQKKDENMYHKDSARKRFLAQNWIFFQFFNFSPNARGPLKIFDVRFSEIFKKKFQKWLLWDLSGIKREQSQEFL